LRSSSALRILRNDRAVADAAMNALCELAERSDGYHRVPLTDALIAAAAAEHGGLAVLHSDAHFDRLAEALAAKPRDLGRARAPSRCGPIVAPSQPYARSRATTLRNRARMYAVAGDWRRSSSPVIFVGAACHAGGRGFDPPSLPLSAGVAAASEADCGQWLHRDER
jgi:hypothetical protein